MEQVSGCNMRKVQNAYDTDVAVIPEMVDSALAHFFTKQLYKPMNLEIRIVPEIQNRRNVTLVIGDTESIEIEKNKYTWPCVCNRQIEREIQKLRLHMAFDEIRKQWNKIRSGEKLSYRNEPVHVHTPRTFSNTSTAKPITTAPRRSSSFGQKSFVKAIRSGYFKIYRSRSL